LFTLLFRLLKSLLKGSVQRKLRWVENSANRCVLAWDCGGGHYIEFLFRRRLVLNIFPFPVSTAKLLGNLYNNRRSAAKSYPRFAYSFVFLMLRQYYWRCDPFSANRRSAANFKKSAKTSYRRCEFAALRLLAQRRRTASPLSAGSDVAPITHSI
jgi:hypothetical protein